MTEPLLIELSAPGRHGFSLPELDVPVQELPEPELLRDSVPLPEVSEIDVVRHFVHLSRINYGIDVGFYPLGSCTMKYNPKVNEDAARLPGFSQIHPRLHERLAQGALQIMYQLQKYLAEIGGVDAVTLHPAAGAHGELTGMLMIRAYHRHREDHARTEVLVPDSAHGTNPATASICGYRVITVRSDARGNIDLAHLRSLVSEKTAALMLTNPNTLGLFEEHILEVTETIHREGGLVYGDGANLNAILGIVKPGDLGFDVIHFNLHKTFSTPHGGGGPGAGPVGVKAFLADFLPDPVVDVREHAGKTEYVFHHPPRSIGKVRSFFGNFGVHVRAYTYIRSLGPAGLRQVAEDAVLAGNYLLAQLRDSFDLPYDRSCMHEFVLSAKRYRQEYGVKTLDIAKRILDYGMYAPTVYFPLIVEEALMIEPTETESKETLDRFAEVMKAIAREAVEQPDLVRAAPHTTPVRRLDDALAARKPDLRWAHHE
jgi:glycine dehydrogenase subunit 2